MPKPDLLCFSHLRWNFVFQRPQHLMSRFARERRVFYFEEPVEGAGDAELQSQVDKSSGVQVLTPKIPASANFAAAYRELIGRFIAQLRIDTYVSWYYTPMALDWTTDLSPLTVVYDCMDELSAFRGAPPEMQRKEAELLESASLVFTGGASLFAAKKNRHHSVHWFPSSIDVRHFSQAKPLQPAPQDQAALPEPRVGFAGVIDERMDTHLLAEVAKRLPHVHFVMVGPVVKIDPQCLPQAPNLHYLGMKSYQQLPAYMSGWKVGLLPFALNESTRHISPTKTPEYLAAGLQVVSSPIRDVEEPYGRLLLVRIAASPEEFALAIQESLDHPPALDFERRVSRFLSENSWDYTFSRMDSLLEAEVACSTI